MLSRGCRHGEIKQRGLRISDKVDEALSSFKGSALTVLKGYEKEGMDDDRKRPGQKIVEETASAKR